MRIGILTGGGDCPGLNAVIRAVVRKGIGQHGDEVIGFRDGWRGVLESDTVLLDLGAVRGRRRGRPAGAWCLLPRTAGRPPGGPAHRWHL